MVSNWFFIQLRTRHLAFIFSLLFYLFASKINKKTLAHNTYLLHFKSFIFFNNKSIYLFIPCPIPCSYSSNNFSIYFKLVQSIEELEPKPFSSQFGIWNILYLKAVFIFCWVDNTHRPVVEVVNHLYLFYFNWRHRTVWTHSFDTHNTLNWNLPFNGFQTQPNTNSSVSIQLTVVCVCHQVLVLHLDHHTDWNQANNLPKSWPWKSMWWLNLRLPAQRQSMKIVMSHKRKQHF